MNPKQLSQKELSYLLSVTRRSIYRWTDDGMPRNNDGTYNGRDCIRWALDRVEEKVKTKNSDPEPGDRWLGKYRKERYKLSKIERETLEGKLLRKEYVSEQWAARVANVAAGLEAFVNRLPPVLELKSRAEIREVLRSEVRELRSSYARTGKFCPPPFDTEKFQNDLGELFDKYLAEK